MPEGVEKYGVVAGIDEVTLGRLQAGFDAIRQIEGWENFRIPAFVWDYVGQSDRDYLLNHLANSIYSVRSASNFANTNRDMVFAFWYTLLLFQEWWRDNPDRPDPYTLDAMIKSENSVLGIPYLKVSRQTIDNEKLFYYMVIYPTEQHAYDANFYRFFYDTGDAWAWSTYVELYDYDWTSMIVYRTGVNDSGTNYYYDEYVGYDYKTDWDDAGEPGGWSDEDLFLSEPQMVGYNVTQDIQYEVLSASAQYSSFGEMSASITLTDQPNVGDVVQIKKGSTIYCTGVVTIATYKPAYGIYEVRLADPVTAQGGEAVYTSGNAISALQDAIEAAGGAFQTSMSTTETVFYPGEPQDFWQFARCVCYAVGGVLQYGKDGTYNLIPTSMAHTVTDDDVIADDDPTITVNFSDYANYVQVTVDASWTEPTSTPVNESYSIAGCSFSVTRLGEQIQTQTVNFGDTDMVTTYTYDGNGYLIQKQTTEEGSGLGAIKKQSTITWSNIQNDGNVYDISETHEEWTYCQLYDNTGGTFYTAWVPTSKVTRDWHVDLDGMATYTEEIWGSEPLFAGNPSISTDLYPELGELIQRYKYVGAVVVDPTAGPLEGHSVAKKYAYTHNGFEDAGGGVVTGTVGWVYLGTEEHSITPPSLEMAAAEETHEVHIIAGAKDPDSVTALGMHKYETQAIALDTDTGMQGFALGVLREKGRIRKATISVSVDAGTILPLDTISWRDMAWVVDNVSIDLSTWTQQITMSTYSSLATLQNAIMRTPVTWVDDISNAITKKTAQYDNVSRGKVISRRGKRRYLVQVEGKAEAIEAKALDDDPIPTNSTVLVVRPTGKNQTWMLLGTSKEHGISMPAVVEEKVTPDVESMPAVTSFTADTYIAVATADIVTLSWDLQKTAYASYGVEIDPGDGTSPILVPAGTNTQPITLWTVGSITPTIRPYIEVGGVKQYGDLISLDASITVEGPAVSSIVVENATNGTVFTGFPYLCVFTYSATLDDTKLDWLKISYDGGATWTTYTSDYSGASLSKLHTWYSGDEGTTSVQAQIAFTQANGQQWTSAITSQPVTVSEHDGATEGAIGAKEYYYFPRAGDYTEAWPTISHDAPVLLSVDGVGGSQLGFELQFNVTGVGSGGSGIIFYTPMRYRPAEYGQTSGGYDGQIVFTVKYENGELRAFIDTASGNRLPWKNGGSWSDDPAARYTVIGTSDTGTVKFVHDISSPEIQVYFNGVYVDETDLGGYYEQYVWEITGVTNPVKESVRCIRYIQAFPSGTSIVSNVTLTVPRRLVEKLDIVGGSWSLSTGYSIPVVFHLPGQPYSFSWTPPY